MVADVFCDDGCRDGCWSQILNPKRLTTRGPQLRKASDLSPSDIDIGYPTYLDRISDIGYPTSQIGYPMSDRGIRYRISD